MLGCSPPEFCLRGVDLRESNSVQRYEPGMIGLGSLIERAVVELTVVVLSASLASSRRYPLPNRNDLKNVASLLGMV